MEHTGLDKLIERFREVVEEDNPRRGYWGELRSLQKEIRLGFNNVRYPTHEEGEKAWKTFHEYIERANERSEAQKTKMDASQRDWQKRQERSQAVKDNIQSQGNSALPATANERAIAELVLAPAKIVVAVLFHLLRIPSSTALEEMRWELLKCNEQMKDAWATYSSMKNELLSGDRQQTRQSLETTQQQLNDAWEKWKEAKGAQKKEKEEKHQNFVERVEKNIANLEEKLSKSNSALERAEAHLEDLQEQFRTAWNDGFKDRCSEWITETENKIESIKESILRLEGWLDEDRRKLT